MILSFWALKIVCCLAVILVFLIQSTTIVVADEINPHFYSKDSSPFGVPYQDWLAKWWQWNFNIPKDGHPRDNYDPAKCSLEQNGPVWFLPDQLTGKETRLCTIPEGKAILVSILSGECDTSNKPLDKIRECATEGNEYGDLSGSLDGVEIQNLNSYRTEAGFFNITVPENNIFDEPAGNHTRFVEGHFVFLEPLPVGTHNLNLKVSVLNPKDSAYNYSAETLYRLFIK